MEEKKEGKGSSYFGPCILRVSQTKIIRPPNCSIRNQDLKIRPLLSVNTAAWQMQMKHVTVAG